MLTVTDHIDASGTQSFAYDNQHRLVQASGPYGALSYTYDATGNRTAMTEDSGTSTYQYAQGTSRLTAISGAQATSFGYNANGNITSKSNKVFVYNEDDRISRVWLGNNQPLAAYVYDLQGRRLRKYTAGQTCYYHYDQDGWLVAETDAAGGLVRGYVRLDGQPLATITGDGSIYYYHNDHLGTPLRMTDATGTVVWAADYRPFGKAELLVNTVENNLRLPGQYFDSATGLHYNWNRFYDPETGRYISADPIGLDGGMNLYGYVENDPVNWVDPRGLAMADYSKDGIAHIYRHSRKISVIDGGTLDTIEKRQKYYQPQISTKTEQLANGYSIYLDFPTSLGDLIGIPFQLWNNNQQFKKICE